MIPYIGGKSYLASWIISNFPSNYTKQSYVEVFGGGGWVLFKKDPSYLETYNDLNKNLVNLFRVIRDNYPEFEHRCEWTLHSSEMYQEAKEKLKDDQFLSEIEQAMYYAINRTQSFSGNGSTWGYQLTAEKVISGKWAPFLKRLQLINTRLKKVQIECLDFEKVIRKYDSPETLFYLDPPYVECEFYYEVGFTRDDHIRLADILKSIKGKFILSYYDHELIRMLYNQYNILTKEKPRGQELLIMNY